jgi:rRNA maturation endonuclease Nob1
MKIKSNYRIIKCQKCGVIMELDYHITRCILCGAKIKIKNEKR